MPKIFTENSFLQSSDIVNTYADKHTPIIFCDTTAIRNKKMRVKVTIGNQHMHPNTNDHYFTYIQLWSLEKLIAEVRFQSGAFGCKPMKPEVDFYIVPQVSLHLTAMAYCTKHGLWKSEEVYVKVTD